MRQNNTIRFLLTALMLLVFGLSATPKILLHNLIANHRDTPVKSNASQQEQFSKDGYNCNWDNLVVESPFTNDFSPASIRLDMRFAIRQAYCWVDISSLHHFHFKLRGPPAESHT